MGKSFREKLSGLAVVFPAGSLLLTTLLGCGPSPEPPPKVFPVKGVVNQKGGTPLKGGVIEFRLETNPGGVLPVTVHEAILPVAAQQANSAA